MIIVTPVKDHLRHKKTLLKLIDDFESLHDTRVSSGVAEGNQTESINKDGSEWVVAKNISSDWETAKEAKREYLEYFYNNVISETMDSIAQTLGLTPCSWIATEAWYQRYSEQGTHDWHNHGKTQFANSYFLELPDSTYKTEIVGSNGEIIEYDAKEGDVVTFPAWLKHRSKPNGKERKTIIAFNSSFELVTRTLPE